MTIFSNIVQQRTSYTYSQVVYGAKFKPMYERATDGSTTILELNKINDFELVKMPVNMDSSELVIE